MSEAVVRRVVDDLARQRITDHVERCEERWLECRKAFRSIYTLLMWCIGLGVTFQTALIVVLASHIISLH